MTTTTFVRALGLDLSVTAIGVAHPDGRTIVIRPQAGADDPTRRLHELAARLCARIRLCLPVDVAVIEGYNPKGHQGLTMARLAELAGVVKVNLFELDIPHVEVAPSSLKKWATGDGRADKATMLDAAVTAGADAASHDAADAWWLRQVALARYHPDPDLPALSDALQALPWPTIDLEEAANAR